MKMPARLLLLAAAGALALAGAGSARPSWVADAGLDFWNVPALKARLAQDQRAAAELDARDDRVMRRIAVKEVLIADVVAGKVGLIEAAAQFRAMNAGSHGYAVVIRSLYPNMSDDERVCRNVIDYVQSYVEGDEDGRALIHRLTEDLNQLKAAGRLTIPGPPLDADRAADQDAPGDAEQ